MISNKDRGVFNKTPGRNGILAYGPSDLDPTIRTYPDLDLISRVSFGSGGSGRLGAQAAARVAGLEVSAAALVDSSPDLA